MRRTMLFLPSNNPNMLINGGQLGADSLIFDLEDAVSPDEKDAARELLKNTLESLDFGKCERIVRINGLDTDYWMEDLRAILPLRPETIMPPKVSGAAYIHQLDEALTELEAELGIPSGSTKILALLETAAGIENAYEVACASPRMTGLFLGAEDLTADLHSRRTKEGSEILYARGRIVCAPALRECACTTRRLRTCRTWKVLKKMPPMPGDSAFLAKPASARPMWVS